MNYKKILEEGTLVLLSLCLSVFVYYGFITNMTIETFTLGEFTQKYTQGIFRYRVLGRELTIFVYSIIQNIPFFTRPDRMMDYLHTNTMTMYHTLFIVNSLCIGLSTFILSRITQLHFIQLQSVNRVFYVLLCASFIVLTQYAITPYDCLSYSVLLSSVYVVLRYHHRRNIMMPLLILLTIAGILTRESQFIFSAFLFALYRVHNHSKLWTIEFVTPITVAGVSLLTYSLLRLYYGFEEAVYYAGPLPEFTTIKYMSVLFFVGLTFLLYVHASEKNKKTLRLFFLFSVPYFFVLLKSGILAEARLWIPHILLSSIIAHLNFDEESLNNKKHTMTIA